MKIYQKISKGIKTGLIASLTLCCVMLIITVVALVDSINLADNGAIIRNVFNLCLSTDIIYYAFRGYKKPHGNALKRALILFSAYLAFCSLTEILYVNQYTAACDAIAAIIISYIAGRLDKVDKNRCLLVAVGTLLLIAESVSIMILGWLSITVVITSLLPMIALAALSFAYIARYEEHKAAGLEDAN